MHPQLHVSPDGNTKNSWYSVQDCLRRHCSESPVQEASSDHELGSGQWEICLQSESPFI